MDKVSIVIVTFNAEKHLQNCLASIRSQAYSPEVIIVDGASQDKTIDIVKQNTDVVTKWISEKDNGIYDAMNKALDLITGDWVYFLGADDTLLPGFSEIQKAFKHKDTIYYGSIISKGIKCQNHAISSYEQAKNGICHQSMFYPKAVFKKYRFDLQYKIAADRHLNMKCYADPEFKMQYLDYTVANFNHIGVSSFQDDLLFEERKGELIRKYHGLFPWMRFMIKKMKKILSNKN